MSAMDTNFSTQLMNELPALGPELARQVRAGFVLKGTTFNQFCLSIGRNRQNVRKALLGQWKGPTAAALVRQLWEASR